MSTKAIRFNCQEDYLPTAPAFNRPSNIVKQRHLEREGKGLIIVDDGFLDIDKEIQSQAQNAGLQNILKLQEMRYGTISNAIVRCSEKGIYADVSNIPTDVASQEIFVANAQAKIAALKKDLGLTDADLASLDYEKLVKLYEAKQAAAAAATSQDEGGNE